VENDSLQISDQVAVKLKCALAFICERKNRRKKEEEILGKNLYHNFMKRRR
jgi:hypothetical protein